MVWQKCEWWINRKNVTNDLSENKVNANSIGLGNGLDKLFLLLGFMFVVAVGILLGEVSSRVKFWKALVYCLCDGSKYVVGNIYL